MTGLARPGARPCLGVRDRLARAAGTRALQHNVRARQRLLVTCRNRTFVSRLGLGLGLGDLGPLDKVLLVMCCDRGWCRDRMWSRPGGLVLR